MEQSQDKVWQQHTAYKANDLTKIQFQFAVFSVKDNKIYKLSGLDYRAARFDLSSESKTLWLHFDNGIMFNFTNEEEFTHYYNLYSVTLEKPMSKENMFNWLAQDPSRLSIRENKV